MVLVAAGLDSLHLEISAMQQTGVHVRDGLHLPQQHGHSRVVSTDQLTHQVRQTRLGLCLQHNPWSEIYLKMSGMQGA